MSGPLLKGILQEQGIKVFRISQYTRSIEDVTITSDPLHQNSHWGRHSFVSVGARGRQNVRRVLINFRTLVPGLMKGKKILAAVLYLKQVNVESLEECGEMINATINVFTVLKAWAQDTSMEGNGLEGDAFLSFNSLERPNADNRPYMEIYYVDEPLTASIKN